VPARAPERTIALEEQRQGGPSARGGRDSSVPAFRHRRDQLDPPATIALASAGCSRCMQHPYAFGVLAARLIAGALHRFADDERAARRCSATRRAAAGPCARCGICNSCHAARAACGTLPAILWVVGCGGGPRVLAVDQEDPAAPTNDARYTTRGPLRPGGQEQGISTPPPTEGRSL
jgi:hypothetical protein